MNALAWRMLWRDWRAGELRVLILALVLAVSSITSVGFFADRVRQALLGQAQQLLGADVVLNADHPLPAVYGEEAARRGLRVADSLSFISMARGKALTQLVGVKAVSLDYPLRGALRITERPAAQGDRQARGIPPTGSVWVDERLLGALNKKIGEQIELGDAKLNIAAVLTLEPDRSISFFNLAPRLLMNQADVAATALVQPGSRISYALYVAGEPDAIAGYSSWIKARLARGEELQSLDNARPEVRRSLDRAQQFLGLTALLAVVLAAVALSLATRRYVQRHLDSYAVLRCLGATQAKLLRLFATEFLVLAIFSCALGCVLGYGTQFVLEMALSKWMAAPLPQPSWLPAMQGFATGLILLLGFALPPLLQLKSVPAMRVIRREIGAPQGGTALAYGLGLVALSALLLWQADDLKLAAYTLAGFAGALIVFTGFAYFALQGLARTGTRGNLAWRYGMASLRRRAQSNIVQVLALSLGLTAILLLGFSRGDLLEAWRNKTPVDAPNRFILNIQPEQRAPLLAFFKTENIATPQLYPMVRARLTAINGKPVQAEDYKDARNKRLVEREFNLSYMNELPPNNRIAAGTWFDAQASTGGALSVEQGIAKRLGIVVGDQLDWSVAGASFSAKVTSLRALDWDSMQVNFFVIATPSLLQDFPTSYITSFRLDPSQTRTMNTLTQRFPNLTVVDVGAILSQVLQMVDQIVDALQFVFLFALSAGILVLYGALCATQDERIQEAAVMRALGATRAQVGRAQRAEFLALGLLSGLLAAAGTSAIAYLLASKVFQLDYLPDPWLWLIGPVLGLICVAFNAWAGIRIALAQPPIVALREA